MYNYFHPEEKYQVWKVVRYHYRHPQALLDIRFFDGEEYRGVFDTAYDSENGCDLDIEMDDPRYDEFFQVAFEITEIIKDGPRRYNEFLTVDYRDFPVLITNVETDEVVYSAETDPLRK
ncbi:hypothetical protein HMPREF0578_0165 [Mobiluncus mulieris 28-1]|uniref:Uncharacterized protein n=2 Tax=Mobiluncus mulieris TaxID=2052 RepID=E0QR23_9ACTO|nr:hypothetical protein [Mobiluncus mulieris]EEZ90260.1 hypothetical protein HMPREF0578_0165 [Mobiluncus mulieris 28-1]EFM46016.1 hypothetical protein HMPREF0580_1338 [Mobiluncus mulieris ATCC 35239]EFN93132.1 hypothetical protein HMPREF9278_1417 [Mobiluncus mulieris FB024-16]MBB5846235.1 hypothetical protein [Mobiluncus mulieris]MCU9970055.1 hypothetical protein [Mobiluncus mulieris]